VAGFPHAKASRPDLDDPWGAWYSCAVPGEVPLQPIPESDVANGRVLAAVAYLPGLCFLSLFAAPENRYVGFHARQGFLLFLVEVIVWVAFGIYDASLGRIPILGFLVGAALRFGIGFTLLGTTLYGMLKGATGEMIRMPFLGDAIEKVPF